MTLEELYREIAGNYEDIRERLRKEERIERFVLLFLKDTSYQTMRQAWEQGGMEKSYEKHVQMICKYKTVKTES